MKKKLLSLALALAACLSLTIPASAYVEDGPGWSYNYDTNVLTLNGAQDMDIFLELGEEPGTNVFNVPPTVVLTPGSKNTAESFYFESDVVDSKYANLYELTFKGTGELVLNGGIWGAIKNIELEDGLTMTGGQKAGDSYPITIESDGSGTNTYRCMANNAPATYIRIAPAAGTKPAETTKPAASSTGFSDVPADSPYAEAIKWAVEQGITNGTSATTFSPNQTCTIGQILTFLWRSAGRPNVSGPFYTDMDKAMIWGQQNLGVGEAVKADTKCVRMTAVQYMWHAAGKPEPTKTANFSDVDIVYKKDVSWAVEQGITNGTSATTFSPYDSCTRGQIVTFLYRASK